MAAVDDDDGDALTSTFDEVRVSGVEASCSRGSTLGGLTFAPKSYETSFTKAVVML